MGWIWARAVAGSVGMAIVAVQPVAAKSPAIECDRWKDSLRAEAARTKMLPPISFEKNKQIAFNIEGMDDIDLLADCKEGRITNIYGTVRGRSEVTTLRWSALSHALAKSFDPTLTTAVINKRVTAMSRTAKKEFIEAKARGEQNAQGVGLENFGNYQMTFELMDGWIHISAMPIEEEG